jgi:hypothetical protein
MAKPIAGEPKVPPPGPCVITSGVGATTIGDAATIGVATATGATGAFTMII